MDDIFLIKFIRGRKYNMDVALDTVLRYYRARRDNPDIFNKLVTAHMNFEDVCHKHRLVFMMPTKDYMGRTVLFLRLGAWTPDCCPLVDMQRMSFLAAEYGMLDQRTHVIGSVGLIDFKGMHISHVRYYTPFVCRRLAYIIQDCCPVRLKGFYIVNNPPIFSTLYTIVKSFLKPKIAERIHLFGTDFDALHKMIPKEDLPPEYGGTGKPFDFEWFEKELNRKNEYFILDAKHGYRVETDEELRSKRSTKQA
ncbi:alpha-tocopherol transfer protein-like isoform X1 [Ornithodoros turicata]